MLRHHLDCSCVLALSAVLVFTAASRVEAADATAALARYKLEVGQQLVYRTTDPPEVFGTGDNKHSRSIVYEWTVNVIRALDDGWRLMFVQKITVNYTYAQNGRDNQQQVILDGYVDLTPAGHLAANRTLGPMADPSLLFPPLPTEAGRSTWNATWAIDETQREFRRSDESADGTFRFVETPHMIFDPIYDWSTERDYAFDVEQGLVTKVVSRTKQGWPEAGKVSVQTVELIDSKRLPEADHEALAAQMTRYLDARQQWEDLIVQSRTDFANTATLLADARQVLVDVRDELTLPAVRARVDDKLKSHDRESEFIASDAAKFAPLIDQPSPDWQTTDLDGNPRALADYRGQVVVLDFWYRGCGWCVRAMPQIKQLAAEFEGQPVAILGINNDRNLDDARQVIEAMGLNYATLKNDPDGAAINTKYKVNGWPTLVLIDPEGIVRYMHFGYKPTLREELSAKIRELLPKE